MNPINPRGRFERSFPGWAQPAITWITGKSLPRQVPLMPGLCTPIAKIFVALLTVALGLALGIETWSVLT